MSFPSINPQSSIPGGLRIGQPFQYRLALAVGSDAATGWSVLDPLPDGLVIDAVTGVISGTPTIAGVYSTRIVATNGDGDSTAVTVAFGVESLPYVSPGVMEINADIDIGLVWNPAITTDAAPLWGKGGDKKIISLGLMKAGVMQDLTVQTINVSLLETDDGEAKPFIVSTGDWEKVGAADNARYHVALDLGTAAMLKMLAAWAENKGRSDGGTVFCEIEVILFQPLPGGTGSIEQPLTFRGTRMSIQDQLH